MTSPIFHRRGETPSSAETRRNGRVNTTPASATRGGGRRERENGTTTARRRSRSPSIANSGYSSPYDMATPGTPGTPIFNRGTYPSSFYLSETLNPTHPPILSVCIDETFSFIKGQQSARHHNLPSSIESITHVLQNG